jgi:hypothetical protein
MFKIPLRKVFEDFKAINNKLSVNIKELSIKKSRINFEFKDASVLYSYVLLELLDDPLVESDILYMTAFDGVVKLTIDTTVISLDQIPEDSLFKDFFDLIDELGEHICKCPSLEYVVSDKYLKVFIDKPSMDSKSLNNLEKVFDSGFTFELNKQRPYILFTPVFEDFNVYATKIIGGD